MTCIEYIEVMIMTERVQFVVDDAEEEGPTSMTQFLADTAEKSSTRQFQLQNSRLLAINLDGSVFTKVGSMVGYRGDIKFSRAGAGSVKKYLKKHFTGEGFTVMRCEGRGKLFVADQGKSVHLLYLDNDSIYVEGHDLLAYESGIDWDIKMVRSGGAFLAGGLFSVKLTGTGFIAVTTHGKPLSLRVAPGHPVVTDPQATVAWSANLYPSIRTDIKLKSLIGRTSGEEFQMEFQGDGYVLIQPFEEMVRQGR